ncbi:MAG: TIGR03943 family protein [Cyanobacteria bacterium P01_A01_bin.135]
MTVRSRPPKFETASPQGKPPIGWLDWLDIALLLLWGLLLLKYWLSGQIYVLLHPNYIWLAIAAGLLLLGLGLWRLLQRLSSTRRPPQQHVSLLPRSWNTLLLVAIAIFGLVTMPRPFTSDIALQRGITETLSLTRPQPQSFSASSDPSEKSLLDWVRTLNVYPEPDAYSGQPVNIDGFVVYPEEIPAGYLMISRFVITCCAADVYPVGLPVRLASGLASPDPDQWVRISGAMSTEVLGDRRQLVIQAAALENIPEPRNPYES